MMYQLYKKSRDMAWEALINCEINSLPVNLIVIAKNYNIKIVKYSESKYVKKLCISDTDGFSVHKPLLRKNIIYYNDKIENKGRVRFTLAHELGHCLLGHNLKGHTNYRNSETDNINQPNEMQANVFARDLLMPATVLHSLRINSADDISKICNVSIQSAEIRYERLLELEKRGMFNKHPFERQIHNNFEMYIKKLLDNGNI